MARGLRLKAYLRKRTHGALATVSASLILLVACQSKEEPMEMTEVTEFATRYAAAWSRIFALRIANPDADGATAISDT